MAIRTKNKRKITVGEDVFYWTCSYRYPENILRLTVMTDEKTRSRLVCKFNYKDFWLYFDDLVYGNLKRDELYDDDLLEATNGIITPWLARQVIDHALQKGWKPLTKGRDFVITETEDKFDTNFWTEAGLKARKSEIRNPKSKIA